MAAIEVRDLVVRYGDTVAVNGVSFEAGAGQILALLGPNGAGKTSTVETLEGYRAPAGGTVRVLGLDPRGDHRALTKRLGVMLQRGGVYPSMSPREAVKLFASYYDESEEPEGLLYRVGLTSVATTPWRRLSGGEQQRLSLALALVGRPWVALLDEPTAGVDPQGRGVIREVIRDLQAAGTCVLITTHELGEAETLADQVVILDSGRVVATGSPAELMTEGRGGEIRFGAGTGLDTAALAAALGAAVTEELPGEYLVQAEAKPATVAALTAWLAVRDIPLDDLRAGRQRLEDVFLRLTTAPVTRPAAVTSSPGAVAPPAAAVPPVAAASPPVVAAPPAAGRGRGRGRATRPSTAAGGTRTRLIHPSSAAAPGPPQTAPPEPATEPPPTT